MSWIKQGHLELVVQDCVHMVLQRIKGWRLHSFSAEHRSSTKPPDKKKKSVFWCPGGFSCFSLCPLPYTLKASRPWRQWDLTLHSKVKIQMRKRTLENASHCHYAKYEVRSMSQNWSLDCLYDADSQFVILGQNPSYVLIRAMGHLLPAWICPSSSSNLTRFQAFFQVCWALLAFFKLYQDWIIN